MRFSRPRPRHAWQSDPEAPIFLGVSDRRIDLADPAFEPTDEELIGLSRRAFAGVRERHEAALARIRAQIAEATEQSLRALDARAAARASK